MLKPETAQGYAHDQANISYKLVIFSSVTALFLIGYFGANALRMNDSVDLITWLDLALPFVPFFIIFYVAGDVYAFIPLLVAQSKQKLAQMAQGYLLIISIAMLFFIFFPVYMPRPVITGTGLFSQMTILRTGLDTSYNAFPSLHVGLCTYSFLLLRQLKPKLIWLTLPVLFLIILSTLLVKQHLVADVLAGLLLASAVYFFQQLFIS